MTDFRLRLKQLGASSGIVLLMTMPFVMFLPAARAASSTLVISEVQFGGAASADEYVELYNKSGSSIDLSTVKLHIRNSGGTDSNKPLTIVHTTIPSQGYALLVNSSATSSLLALADATYSSSGNTLVGDGSVYISSSTTNDVSLATDLVGWGSQPVPGFEGTVVPTFSAGESIERKPGGINGSAQDTDNNASDFVVRSTPNPQNTTSATQPSAPQAPTLLSAVAGDGQVTLSWTAVEGAHDYVIFQNSVPLVDMVAAPTTTKVTTGLTNGTTYSFQVVALNNFGTPSVGSNSLSATPISSIVVSPTPIDASVVYRGTGSTAAATNFGITSVRAEVTMSGVVAADMPQISLQRPGSELVVIPLELDSGSNTWKTKWDFVVYKAGVNGRQDGKVTATLTTTTGKTFNLLAGSFFTVDTIVNKPVVVVMSRCSTAQDSFTATTDSDVVRISIYKSADLTLSNLIAVSSVVNGKTDEIFIGDNAFAALYLVAQDSIGNMSDTSVVVNDMTAPAQPSLQLEAGDKVITASWSEVSDASVYVLRWRKVGESTWQEKVTTARKHDLVVTNETEYEVAAASRDGACNQSEFTTHKGTAHTAAILAAAARGGVADQEAALFAESIQVAMEKDGAATTTLNKSTLSQEEDKDQNGIKDTEEDKNNNGVKDGEEGTVSPSPTPSNPPSALRDRSRVIVGIAILLILAGAALAAYSWYRGNETEAAQSAATPEPTQPEDQPTAPKKRSTRGKRKTRW